MTLHLYTISGAPRPWRVLLALVIKKLDFEVTYLEASKGEHKAPAFLKVNSRGTVPVLEAGNVVLRDSFASLAWLDRAFPAMPLFGDSADEAALVWQDATEAADYLRDAATELLRPIFFEGAETPDDALHGAALQMSKELARIDAKLRSTRYVSLDKPGASDAVCYPEARLVRRACETRPALMEALGFQAAFPQFPQLARWMRDIEALTGIEKTMPPHWRS